MMIWRVLLPGCRRNCNVVLATKGGFPVITLIPVCMIFTDQKPHKEASGRNDLFEKYGSVIV
jgi:hypothetical protein